MSESVVYFQSKPTSKRLRIITSKKSQDNHKSLATTYFLQLRLLKEPDLLRESEMNHLDLSYLTSGEHLLKQTLLDHWIISVIAKSWYKYSNQNYFFYQLTGMKP